MHSIFSVTRLPTIFWAPNEFVQYYKIDFQNVLKVQMVLADLTLR